MANFLKITVLLYALLYVLLYCFIDSAKGLQKALHSLNQACEEWKLAVNENKTKVMIFSRRKYSGNVNFTLNNKVFDIVDDFKCLVVTFSRTGTFKNVEMIGIKKHEEPCLVYLKTYD